jgi:hypothetical protein
MEWSKQNFHTLSSILLYIYIYIYIFIFFLLFDLCITINTVHKNNHHHYCTLRIVLWMKVLFYCE